MMKISCCNKILAIAAAIMLCSMIPAFAEPKAYTPEEHLEAADRALNSNYKRIQALYANDKLFLEKLRGSQRAWLKFRDAEIEALFPHSKEGTKYYGNAYGDAKTHWLAALTEDRCSQLARRLEGAEKRDSYRESIKVKPVQQAVFYYCESNTKKNIGRNYNGRRL